MIAELERKNSLLLAELDHRLKCVMQLVVSLTNMLLRTVSKGEVSADVALSRLENWLQSFSIIFRELAHRKDASELSASNLMTAITSHHISKFSSGTKLTIDTNRLNLNVKKVEPIGLIIHEIGVLCLSKTPSEFRLYLTEKNRRQQLKIWVLFHNTLTPSDRKNTLSNEIIELMGQQLKAEISFSNEPSEMIWNIRYGVDA